MVWEKCPYECETVPGNESSYLPKSEVPVRFCRIVSETRRTEVVSSSVKLVSAKTTVTKQGAHGVIGWVLFLVPVPKVPVSDPGTETAYND
jgi:hypothetical protein